MLDDFKSRIDQLEEWALAPKDKDHYFDIKKGFEILKNDFYVFESILKQTTSDVEDLISRLEYNEIKLDEVEDILKEIFNRLDETLYG